jgi:hypothetical protein
VGAEDRHEAGSGGDGEDARTQRGIPHGAGRGGDLDTMSAPSSSSSPVRASTPLAHGLRIVHSPSGLVVDGLDVEMLAALLKRMT